MTLDYREITHQFSSFFQQLGSELIEVAHQRRQEGKSAIETAELGDFEAEEKIRSKINSLFDSHNILGEEKGLEWKDSEYTWVIDPIDGSSNYGNGFVHWVISLALCHRGEGVVGMIYAPVLKRYYTGVRGEGAQLNGQQIRSLKIREYKYFHLQGFSGYRDKLRFFYPGKLRQLGSVAMDLALLAEGKFATIFEPEPHLWDMAAGYIIAREAGAVVYRKDGKPLEPFDFRDSSTFALLGKANAELPDPEWK